MEITVIQILAIIFAVFALSRAFLRFKDKKVSTKEFLFWSVIWIAVIVVALLPRITGIISSLLGVGRGVDIIIYISIIALFYLIFRVYVKIDSLEQNISKVDAFWNKEKADMLNSLSQKFKVDLEVERQGIAFSSDYKVSILTIVVSFNQCPLAFVYSVLTKPQDEWVFTWGTVRYLIAFDGSLGVEL